MHSFLFGVHNRSVLSHMVKQSSFHFGKWRPNSHPPQWRIYGWNLGHALPLAPKSPFYPSGDLKGEASFRLLRPKKGQQKFSSKKCSKRSQKGQQKFASVTPPSPPVSRLKSKIFTSNLAKKKFAPQPKHPGDAYDSVQRHCVSFVDISTGKGVKRLGAYPYRSQYSHCFKWL